MNFILKITTLLLVTLTTIKAQNNSVQLLQKTFEACDFSKDNRLFKTRISAIQCKGDTTLITVAFTDMCAQEWDGKIAVKGDTVNLFYEIPTPSPEIFCTCCYSITYTLLGYDEKQHLLRFRNQAIKFSETEYFIEEMKREILEDGSLRMARYLDDVIQSESIGTKQQVTYRYYKDGVLTLESIKKKGEQTIIRHYKNGVLIVE